MTKEISPENNLENGKKPRRKLKKLIIALALIIAVASFIAYFHAKELNRIKAQSETQKFSNIEGEIFDLSEDERGENSSHFDDKLSDLTLGQLKAGGADFAYRLLLKNQSQISSLKNELQNLKTDFAKYKTQEKTSKEIFIYVELRQRFYAGEDFSETLKSLDTIALTDRKLQEKLAQLKPLLKNFYGSKVMIEKFDRTIPYLIAAKNNDPHGSLLEKMRFNLSRLVVIRKLDDKAETIDGVIRRTEKSLRANDYQSAINSLTMLDEKYRTILAGYLTELNNAAELQRVDEEILLYLRGII